MGKVRKPTSLSNEICNINEDSKKKKRNRSKISANEMSGASEEGIQSTKSVGKIMITDEEQQTKTIKLNQANQDDDDVASNKQSTKRKKRSKTNKEKCESSGADTTSTQVHIVKNEPGALNKKIKFTYDGPQEDQVDLKKSESQKNTHKFLQGEEAEVKDEDIDKFCDELDDEDNVQFDDWVKQIEEKLHSNKKKKT